MRQLFHLIVSIFVLSSCAEKSVDIQYKQGEFWPGHFRNNSFPTKSFADNKIYTADMKSDKQNYLYCLNLVSGNVDWASKVASWAGYPPIVEDSFIYYCSYLGDLYKFDKQGQVLWNKKFDKVYSGHSLNEFNQDLMVSDIFGGVYEYDFETGNLVKIYGKQQTNTTLPVFANAKMYIGGFFFDSTVKDKDIYAIDKSDKRFVLQKNVGDFFQKLFIFDTLIFFQDTHFRLHCLNAISGDSLWTSEPLLEPGKLNAVGYPHLLNLDSTVVYFNSDMSYIPEISKKSGAIKRTSYEQLLKQKALTPSLIKYEIKKEGKTYQVTVSERWGLIMDMENNIEIKVETKL